MEAFADELELLKEELMELFGDWEGERREDARVLELGTFKDMQQLHNSTQAYQTEVTRVVQHIKVHVCTCSVSPFSRYATIMWYSV